MNYKIPVPRSRGFQNELLDTDNLEAIAEANDQIKDMFLHALFARIAANDGETWEFETNYDPKDNDIELLISEKFISILETVAKGPKFVRYITWLIEDSVTDVTNGILWRLVDGTDDTITTAFKAVFEKSASFNNIKNIGDSGATATVNWCNGNKQQITLTDDVTLTFQDPPGPASLQLITIQGSIGNSIIFPANVKFPKGNQPNSTNPAGSIDIWSFLYDGTNYYATAATNFQ